MERQANEWINSFIAPAQFDLWWVAWVNEFEWMSSFKWMGYGFRHVPLTQPRMFYLLQLIYWLIQWNEKQINPFMQWIIDGDSEIELMAPAATAPNNCDELNGKKFIAINWSGLWLSAILSFFPFMLANQPTTAIDLICFEINFKSINQCCHAASRITHFIHQMQAFNSFAHLLLASHEFKTNKLNLFCF